MGSGYVPQICLSHVVTAPFAEFPEEDGYLATSHSKHFIAK